MLWSIAHLPCFSAGADVLRWRAELHEADTARRRIGEWGVGGWQREKNLANFQRYVTTIANNVAKCEDGGQCQLEAIISLFLSNPLRSKFASAFR